MTTEDKCMICKKKLDVTNRRTIIFREFNGRYLSDRIRNRFSKNYNCHTKMNKIPYIESECFKFCKKCYNYNGIDYIRRGIKDLTNQKNGK